LAGQREVRDAVRPTLHFGHEVLDLPRDATSATIGAAPSPLPQQIFSPLIACQLTLLVVHAPDLCMLEELGIEAHQFKVGRRDGTDPTEARHPGGDIVEAALQRGWQPARSPTAVSKPAPTVACVPLSAGAPDGPSSEQSGPNRVPSTLHLGSPENLAG